jgi:hypothetical protein
MATEQDTLSSVALSFDTSVEWLKSTNPQLDPENLTPGDIVQIHLEPEDASTVPTIQVDTFDLTRPDRSDSGALLLGENFLRFEYPPKRSLVIQFSNLVHCGVVIDPRVDSRLLARPRLDTPHLLAVSYLKVVNDPRSFQIRYFAGPFARLTAFNQRVVRRAAALRDGAQGLTLKDISEYQRRAHVNTMPQPATPRWRIFRKPPAETETQQAEPPAPRPIEVMEFDIGSQIISKSEVTTIRKSLPVRFRKGEWSIAFQLQNDGTTYQTIFRNCEGRSGLVLIILTDRQEKIGCFLPQGLQKNKRYYGTGETFVFKVTPEFEAFRWSRKNENFVASSLDGIVVGAPDAAIWIDEQMLMGLSAECETFDSPILTSEERFKVVDIEIWQVGGPVSSRIVPK